MSNHPNRPRGPYRAELFGSSWAQGPVVVFPTIRAARAWAESYGTTADSCTIRDCKERIVGEHQRSTSGDGTRWFRAAI